MVMKSIKKEEILINDIKFLGREILRVGEVALDKNNNKNEEGQNFIRELGDIMDKDGRQLINFANNLEKFQTEFPNKNLNQLISEVFGSMESCIKDEIIPRAIKFSEIIANRLNNKNADEKISLVKKELTNAGVNFALDGNNEKLLEMFSSIFDAALKSKVAKIDLGKSGSGTSLSIN